MNGFKKGHIPWSKNKKGIHLSEKTEFKKGCIPWNKDLKGVQKVNKGSIKKGEHKSVETEFKNDQLCNENNFNWKGDDVGYFALHTWLFRKVGKATLCENREKNFLPFKCSCKSKTYHWANKSRKYKRDPDDWIQLCVSCHLKADKKDIKL